MVNQKEKAVDKTRIMRLSLSLNLIYNCLKDHEKNESYRKWHDKPGSADGCADRIKPARLR